MVDLINDTFLLTERPVVVHGLKIALRKTKPKEIKLRDSIYQLKQSQILGKLSYLMNYAYEPLEVWIQ